MTISDVLWMTSSKNYIRFTLFVSCQCTPFLRFREASFSLWLGTKKFINVWANEVATQDKNPVGQCTRSLTGGFSFLFPNFFLIRPTIQMKSTYSIYIFMQKIVFLYLTGFVIVKFFCCKFEDTRIIACRNFLINICGKNNRPISTKCSQLVQWNFY